MRIVSLLFLLFSFFSLVAQNDSLPKKAILLELGGNAGYGSLNFEYSFFQKNKIKLASRIGLGTYKIIDFEHKFNPDIIVPVNLALLYGQKNKLEFGLGFTFANHPLLILDNKTRKNSLAGNAVIGYRIETKKNFIFKFAFTPMFENEKIFRPWFGISIGIKIK